jgi:hypothetical protein
MLFHHLCRSAADQLPSLFEILRFNNEKSLGRATSLLADCTKVRTTNEQLDQD